jgi:hypothetical protein
MASHGFVAATGEASEAAPRLIASWTRALFQDRVELPSFGDGRRAIARHRQRTHLQPTAVVQQDFARPFGLKAGEQAGSRRDNCASRYFLNALQTTFTAPHHFNVAGTLRLTQQADCRDAKPLDLLRSLLALSKSSSPGCNEIAKRARCIGNSASCRTREPPSPGY